MYLAYAAPAGTAFIDRALYLPRSWTSDPDRCRTAGVPEDTIFATKPALAAVKDRTDGKIAALAQARKLIRQACHILAELGDDALTAA